ncbi:MAG: 50S ribosomal protein L11 methyltransferase [Bacteroidales bacterium]
MAYIKIAIASGQVTDHVAAIIIAKLGELGIESFEEPGDQLFGYLPENAEKQNEIHMFLDKMMIPWKESRIEDQNWNAKWEESFREILIDDKVMIKAEFHKPEVKPHYVINIHPRMAFGTGHHETTRLVIRIMLEMNLKDKQVLDWGTGSGVLAVMADMMGAKSVLALDIDDWSVNNAGENVKINEATGITVRKGSLEAAKDDDFDLILANINKNTLIENAETLVSRLKTDGTLVLSGFYEDDLDEIKNKYLKFGLDFEQKKTENDWCSGSFLKKS